MNAEQFIENNYHTRVGLEADKLIEDKTGVEVSFEQIAEAYHKYMMEEIEPLPDGKDMKCLGCGLKWKEKYPTLYTKDYCYDCYFKFT
jgi:hypothetical protein